MKFDLRQGGDLDGTHPAGDDRGEVPRLDRRQMLIGLAAGGFAGLAGCMDQLTDHEFEADPVRIPSDDVERFGLQQVEEDEVVVEEERSIGGQDIRAEVTSHVVGYEAAEETGGEAQFRTTRDIAPEEVVVTVPLPQLQALEDDVLEEFETFNSLHPGIILFDDDGRIDDAVTRELSGVSVLFPGDMWDSFEGKEIHDALVPVDDIPPFDFDFPSANDTLAVEVGHLQEALDRDVPEAQVGRLLENSMLLADSETLDEGFSNIVPQLGIAMFPGDMWFPGDTWLSGDTWFPSDTWYPAGWSDWYPAGWSDWFPEDNWLIDSDAAFVDSSAVVKHEDIEAGRLDLLEDGGVLFPGDMWEEVANENQSPGVPDYLGALASPKAEVMGQTLNPIADASPEELLTDEERRSFVGRLGLDGVEDGWVEGPERANSEVGRLLGEDAPIETFVGLTGSRENPKFAVVHVGRLETDDDVVFSALSSSKGVEQVGRVFVGDDGYVTESDLGTSIQSALDVVEAFEQG